MLRHGSWKAKRIMADRETLNIRPAAADDLSGVLSLYAQPEIDDGRVLPLGEAERLLQTFSRYPDYVPYVAEQKDCLVGSFALLITDNIGHLGSPSAIVEDVVVDPQFHGMGIGRQMMEFAMRKARDKGCYKLMLSSNARRERAHAFYDSLGFERHGLSFRVELDRVPA
jgi:GNAT superfamily N-acetyltransferase